jgi:hypothetical protein
MHRSLSRRLAAGVAALAATVLVGAVLAGPALAHGGHGQRAGFSGARAGGGGCGCRAGSLVSLDVAANALGLTSVQLRADLKSGQSLAQIAAAAGKSIDTVATAITTAATSTLNAAVASGSLTAGQAQAVLIGVPQQVATLVSGTLRQAKGLLGGCGLLRLDISAAASALGLTVAQLRTELSAGKTLSAIAAAAGKSVASVAAAATAAVKATTDAAVASGALSQAQASGIVAGASTPIASALGG